MAKTVKSVTVVGLKTHQKKKLRMAEKSGKSHRRTFFAKALKSLIRRSNCWHTYVFDCVQSGCTEDARRMGRKRHHEWFALEYVDRVNKMAEGRLRIDYLTAGAVVKPFEITDAVSKGVLDAGHQVPVYWYGKSKLHRCLVQGLSTERIQNKCWVG